MYTEKEVRELCEKMFMEGRLFEKASYQPMSIPQTIDYYFKKFTAQHSVQRTAEPLCQVCLMPLSEHVFECDVPQTRRR